MKAEFFKWYDCEAGQMPEDFENTIDKRTPSDGFLNPSQTVEVLVYIQGDTVCEEMAVDIRRIDDIDNPMEDWHWEYYDNIVKWMLIRPFWMGN